MDMFSVWTRKGFETPKYSFGTRVDILPVANLQLLNASLLQCSGYTAGEKRR